MARRSKTEVDRSIKAAACLFATHTRDAKEIARLLDTSERNVHRWSKEDWWEKTLQFLEYEGERNFRVKPRRG